MPTPKEITQAFLDGRPQYQADINTGELELTERFPKNHRGRVYFERESKRLLIGFFIAVIPTAIICGALWSFVD